MRNAKVTGTSCGDFAVAWPRYGVLVVTWKGAANGTKPATYCRSFEGNYVTQEPSHSDIYPDEPAEE